MQRIMEQNIYIIFLLLRCKASAVVQMKYFYSCKYLSRLKNICLFEFVVSVTLARAQALAPSFIFPFIE